MCGLKNVLITCLSTRHENKAQVLDEARAYFLGWKRTLTSSRSDASYLPQASMESAATNATPLAEIELMPF